VGYDTYFMYGEALLSITFTDDNGDGVAGKVSAKVVLVRPKAIME
jgi:hypothetical protein